jgi:FkbM family methyltransferase
LKLNFSAISNRSRLGSALRLPLRLLPKNSVVPILQGPLRGKRWISGAGNHGYWLGSYEFEKQQIFEREVRPGFTVYDIGAHVGFYTLLAATLTGDQGRVYAFEPNAANVVTLQKHLELNALHSVTVLAAAVAEFDGQSLFDSATNSSMGHLSPTGRAQVRTVSLDQMLRSGLVKPPQLVKIDVEGAEGSVLRGAERLLVEHRPVVLLATHGREFHLECCRLLRELGSSLEAVGGGSLETTDEIIARC